MSKFAQFLEGEGFSLFVADIAAPQRWETVLAQEIRSCSAMLVLLTSNAASSQRVKEEFDFARGLGVDPIVLRFDEAQLASGWELALASNQHLQVSESNVHAAVGAVIGPLRLTIENSQSNVADSLQTSLKSICEGTIGPVSEVLATLDKFALTSSLTDGEVPTYVERPELDSEVRDRLRRAFPEEEVSSRWDRVIVVARPARPGRRLRRSKPSQLKLARWRIESPQQCFFGHVPDGEPSANLQRFSRSLVRPAR